MERKEISHYVYKFTEIKAPYSHRWGKALESGYILDSGQENKTKTETLDGIADKVSKIIKERSPCLEPSINISTKAPYELHITESRLERYSSLDEDEIETLSEELMNKPLSFRKCYY